MGDVRDAGSVRCRNVQIQPDAVEGRFHTELEDSDGSCAVAVNRPVAGCDTEAYTLSAIMKHRESIAVLADLVSWPGIGAGENS